MNYLISLPNGKSGDFRHKTAEFVTGELAPITIDCTFQDTLNLFLKLSKLSQSLIGNMHFLESFPQTCIHIGKVGPYKYKSQHHSS